MDPEAPLAEHPRNARGSTFARVQTEGILKFGCLLSPLTRTISQLLTNPSLIQPPPPPPPNTRQITYRIIATSEDHLNNRRGTQDERLQRRRDHHLAKSFLCHHLEHPIRLLVQRGEAQKVGM
ncbi:hypothetical protein E2C01_072469 [Portunus trituberculatus]|uniref:Uncharacterized protein n=1 Tax=Portunus trituberculatus TaxID=210409 RepID=A0A5B7IAT7_PORTR|nr:hypothetical protein [Portunus trituberculatus]